MLLTKKDSTPTVVSDYLKSSHVTNVTVIGDANAISAQQVSDLTDAGYTVNRLGGHNRYGTAKAVIDSVASGPLSYGANLPLAITKTDTLPQATIDALKDAGVIQVNIVGGTNAVSNAVVVQLALNQITVKDRINGGHRVETATLLATYERANYTADVVDNRVNVASGDDNLEGSDALSGGPVSGKEHRPLLITRDKDVAGTDLTDYLKANASTLSGSDNHIFGDAMAVSDAVEQDLKAAASNAKAATTITKADLTTDAPTPALPPATGTVSIGDVIALTFSQAVTQTNGLLSLTDKDGDTFQIQCGTVPTPGDKITTALCSFEGAPGATSGTTLTLRLFEDAADTNTRGDGKFTYPATITAVTGVGTGVDVAGSADKTVG